MLRLYIIENAKVLPTLLITLLELFFYRCTYYHNVSTVVHSVLHQVFVTPGNLHGISS